MTDRAPGPGELAARASARRRMRILIGSLILGGVLGGTVGALDATKGHGAPFQFDHMVLPPAVAVAVAIGFLIALVALPIYMFGKVDEMKVLQNLRAMTAGFLAMIGGYPAWQMLAAGGLAAQPTAFGLFLLGYGVTLATFLVLKLRG